MELKKKEHVVVDVRTVEVHVKVCDSGNYALMDADGVEVASIDEGYVPCFFPGDHYGDYLILDIDLETGRILNWQKPTPQQVADAFNLET